MQETPQQKKIRLNKLSDKELVIEVILALQEITNALYSLPIESKSPLSSDK